YSVTPFDYNARLLLRSFVETHCNDYPRVICASFMQSHPKEVERAITSLAKEGISDRSTALYRIKMWMKNYVGQVKRQVRAEEKKL
ncbi:hypothetical protein O6249_24120, partial [Salmonella enterica subsp. enterica]|uniref:hypothetical protein n=1 Tax=Salmonella enterica TaxID=28901 RepID=UPI0022B601ED